MRKSLVLLAVMLAASLAVSGCEFQGEAGPECQCCEHQPELRGGHLGGRECLSSEEGRMPRARWKELLAKRTIYFDFDSSEIKGEGTGNRRGPCQIPREDGRHEDPPRRPYRRAWARVSTTSASASVARAGGASRTAAAGCG